MYKLLPLDILTNQQTTVMRLSDKAIIPFDDANTDYIEYLEWINEGNTPEEAE